MVNGYIPATKIAFVWRHVSRFSLLLIRIESLCLKLVVNVLKDKFLTDTWHAHVSFWNAFDVKEVSYPPLIYYLERVHQCTYCVTPLGWTIIITIIDYINDFLYLHPIRKTLSFCNICDYLMITTITFNTVAMQFSAWSSALLQVVLRFLCLLGLTISKLRQQKFWSKWLPW